MVEKFDGLGVPTEGEPVMTTVLRVCLRYAEGLLRNVDTPLVPEEIRAAVRARPSLPLFGQGSVSQALAAAISAPFNELVEEGAICREDCEVALMLGWFDGLAHLHRAAAGKRRQPVDASRE